MRVPIDDRDQSLADFFEWQSEERFKARRGQAARRQGGSNKVRRATPILSSAARSVDVHSARRSPRQGFAVRAAQTPTPRLFVSVLLLLGVGFFCALYALLHPLWEWVFGGGGR